MKSKAKGKGDHTPPAVEEYENGASRTGGRRNDDGCAASRGINIRVKKKARSRANSDDEVRIFFLVFSLYYYFCFVFYYSGGTPFVTFPVAS